MKVKSVRNLKQSSLSSVGIFLQVIVDPEVTLLGQTAVVLTERKQFTIVAEL